MISTILTFFDFWISTLHLAVLTFFLRITFYNLAILTFFPHNSANISVFFSPQNFITRKLRVYISQFWKKVRIARLYKAILRKKVRTVRCQVEIVRKKSELWRSKVAITFFIFYSVAITRKNYEKNFFLVKITRKKVAITFYFLFSGRNGLP